MSKKKRLGSNGKPLGRPSLYDKPHRTTIMFSEIAKDVILPDLTRWLDCSISDVYEAAIRAFHKEQKELRQKRMR